MTLSVPLYRMLRSTLEGEIADGTYPVGSRFPTDHELRNRFQVSRHTIREALRSLQDEGLLARVPGSGTVVRAAPSTPRYEQVIESLEQLYDNARTARMSIASIGWIRLGSALAYELGRPEGERWLRFAGLRTIGHSDTPRSWVEVYVAEQYGQIRDEITGEDPIHQSLERRFGLEISALEMTLSARILTGEHAALLGAPEGGPGLLVRRSYFSNAKDPIEIALSLQPGDRFTQTMRFRRASGAAPKI